MSKVIPINDMFRLREFTRDYWQTTLWRVEEWYPHDYRPEGIWKAATPGLDAKAMAIYLERNDCPQKALDAFKGITGENQCTDI